MLIDRETSALKTLFVARADKDTKASDNAR